MREQSSSNITHTHKVFRGGETKVMKKSLLSLLIFALVFTMAAPAFAATGAAVKLSDISNSYAKEEIEALVEAGIIGGYADGTFKPANSITRAEFAKILALVLDLEEDAAAASVFTDVPAWAKGYVGALVNAELTTGVTATTYGSNQNISREQLATFFVRAWDLEEAAEEVNLTPKFNDADKVAPYAKANVALAGEIGFINGLPNGNFDPKGNAQRQAVARLAYEFYTNSEEYLAAAEEVIKENAPVPAELAVEKVYADNMKEVVIEFNQAVEEESATDKANFSLKSGKVIKLATLSEDATTVTLTLEGTLTNNKADAVSVSGVSAKEGDSVLDVKNVEFTTVDNTLPEVKEVTALGTKALKVEFSEPVQTVQQKDFTLDGKAFFGKIDTASNYRSVVIRPYSTTALEVGDHTLTVSGVKDFANFVALNSTHEFTVVEDKDAPTIEEATATLEYVTITFSEIVDPETISASKVYWKSGDSKKAAASYEQLADNKYRYHFNESNFLPTGSVTIYVEGVKDYSGNEIAKDTSVSVTPVIDQTRPEVKKVEALDKNTIKVTFSKPMEEASVKERNNYTVKNKDDKVVSVEGAKFVDGSNKEVLITLYGSLSTGNNTLTIKNLKDSTKLKNTMLDYTGTVTLADTANPKIASKFVNKSDRRVVIEFNKKMDIESLVNYSNYHITLGTDVVPLTEDIAEISVLQDGKVVVFQFVERYKNKVVDFADGSVTYLHVLGVKDTSNNLLDEFIKQNNKIDLLDEKLRKLSFGEYSSDYDGYAAGLTDRKTLKVKFNAGVIEARTDAFTLTDGNEITSVEVDGTSTVTLKFRYDVNTDATRLGVKVDFGRLVTLAGTSDGGTEVLVNNDESKNILDLVSPVVDNDGKRYEIVRNNVIVIPFSEELSHIAGATPQLMARDLEVRRVADNDKLLTAGTDYVVNVNGKNLEVTIKDGKNAPSIYTVKVLDNAQYIVDKSDAQNVISATSARETNGKVNQGAANDEKAAKDALDNAINAAKDLEEKSSVGTDSGQYSQEAKNALLAAITKAEGVLNAETSKEADFKKATSDLNDAVQTFKDSVVKPQPEAPTVELAPGSEQGTTKLVGSNNTMEYKLNGAEWESVTADDMELVVAEDDEIQIRVKADPETNTPAGKATELTVEAADIA